MAGSRLEKIGTIFSRASGLLRTGVLKVEDKPIWYDVYAMHPPAEEPRYDRPAPNIEIHDIFYEEDLIRAKFHKKVQGNLLGTIKLNDRQYKSTTQKFIDLYKNYQAQGALDDDKVFEVAFQKVQEDAALSFESRNEQRSEERIEQRSEQRIEQRNVPRTETRSEEKEIELDLVDSYKEAQQKSKVGLKDLLNEDDSDPKKK